MNDKTPEPTPFYEPATPCPDYPPVLGNSALLTDEELAASRAVTFADWDGKSDIWLFGYGSLIWNPGLPTLEAVRGKVHGYHRGLYLWSRVNRGTPEQPGLVLALDRGGSCTGMAFRLSGTEAHEHLEVLWRREMAMGSYRPAWLPCTLIDGRRVDALAFVMRRDVVSYTGKLADPIVRTVLGCASGRYGTTLDYVSRTVVALRESGMPDRALEALLRRCKGQNAE
ncbi:gamma-glutamylcyclotransferase [Caballeronia sp. LP006]|uniref:gamma-glutamylcyclotransferase n=1 Tax=unclassified Caballeronia TaxID=2646786 RepID=UPI001FD30C9B|nr:MULTISPECIES: gamma-glutamylcyclotransferase [unclassified Caballeronia]MDR5770574.1 gamma-glutamylcyclotransferase [Caballeronia sp. LZ002]MDR5803026.1 gamma-glutamylcyclotransferase [Caballeronia sp. LZ001]MDR5830321.1 gamma-glutamylcyclotransferase [Caballeronia sp. LP006]MDR5846011.1 gamma-glutamylcyclotransferase [Caballeronia sp. LZ003]